MSRTTKATQVGQDMKLRAGLPGVLGKTLKFTFEGEEVHMGEILDTLVANAEATANAREQLRLAVETERAYREQNGSRVVGLRTHLRLTRSAEELAACGLTPLRKKRVLSADQRTAATAKLRKTRATKGTLGAQQAREKEAQAVITATFASPAVQPDGHPAADKPAANGAVNGAAAVTTKV
jgi:hypothetical protein